MKLKVRRDLFIDSDLLQEILIHLANFTFRLNSLAVSKRL